MSLRDFFQAKPAASVGIDREMVAKFRRVFDNPDGREVLSYLLSELGHFDTEIETERDLVEQNFAKRLLRYLGVWNAENVNDLVEAFMRMSPQVKEDQDESSEEARLRRILNGASNG